MIILRITARVTPHFFGLHATKSFAGWEIVSDLLAERLLGLLLWTSLRTKERMKGWMFDPRMGLLRVVRESEERRKGKGIYPVEWLFMRSGIGFQELDFHRIWFLHNEYVNVDVYIEPDDLQFGTTHEMIFKLCVKSLEGYRIDYCQLAIAFSPEIFLIKDFEAISETDDVFSFAPLQLLKLLGVNLSNDLINKLSIRLRRTIKLAEHFRIAAEEERIVWTVKKLDFDEIR